MSRSEAKETILRAVLESVSDGVWILDGHGRTLYMNDVATALLRLQQHGTTTVRLAEYIQHLLDNQPTQARPGIKTHHDVTVLAEDLKVAMRLTVISRVNAQNSTHGHIVLLAPPWIGAPVEPLKDGSNPTHAPLAAVFRPVGRFPHAQTAAHRRSAYAQLTLDQLTPRERAVTDELLRGNRVPTIARRLGRSQSTIRNQLSSTYRKLGVQSQQELIDLLRDSRPWPRRHR